MKYTNEKTERLFNDLKNGDSLGLYNNIWYYLLSKGIYFLTGGAIDHVGMAFNVRREGNVVRFEFGEQLVFRGKGKKSYNITKYGDEYQIDSRFRKKKLDVYRLRLNQTITEEQNKILEKYWYTRKPYKIWELPFTLNWFYKLTNLFRKNKNTKKYSFCSGAVMEAYEKIGITPAKSDDAAVSPIELTRLSFIDKIEKIDTTCDVLHEPMEEVKKAIKCKNRAFYVLILCSSLIAYFATYKQIKHRVFDKFQVERLVKEASKQCKQGYYVTILKFGKENCLGYTFEDVVSYNDVDKEVYSVKDEGLNPYYYKKDLQIGTPLHTFLSSKPSIQGQYVDKKELVDARETHPAINEILNAINVEINATAYSVVRTPTKGLVKRFTHLVLLSKQKGAKSTCTRQNMTELTQGIAGRLYDAQKNPNNDV